MSDTRKLAFEKRFWDRVDRQTGGKGCWLWSGARTTAGYGYVRLAGRKAVQAHRVCRDLLEKRGGLFNGCGEKLCVNPAHWGEKRVARPRSIRVGKKALEFRDLARKLYARGTISQRWLARELGLAVRTINLWVKDLPVKRLTGGEKALGLKLDRRGA